MDDTPIVIYEAASVEQAHLLKNLLADEGIQAFVQSTASGEGPVDWPVAARVYVHENDARTAREIAMEFDVTSAEATLTARYYEDDGETSDEGWPRCPSCQRRRLTRCPVCETAGTDFAEGFFPYGSEDPDEDAADAGAGTIGTRETFLVICPVCDEPFAPRHPRRCEWCGYGFADGWETQTRPTFEPLDLNPRVLVTIAGLLLTVLAMVLFFAYLATTN
jgi:hypothetical protein